MIVAVYSQRNPEGDILQVLVNLKGLKGEIMCISIVFCVNCSYNKAFLWLLFYASSV